MGNIFHCRHAWCTHTQPQNTKLRVSQPYLYRFRRAREGEVGGKLVQTAGMDPGRGAGTHRPSHQLPVHFPIPVVLWKEVMLFWKSCATALIKRLVKTLTITAPTRNTQKSINFLLLLTCGLQVSSSITRSYERIHDPATSWAPSWPLGYRKYRCSSQSSQLVRF